MDKQAMLKYLETKAQEFYELSDSIWNLAEVRLVEHESAKVLSDYIESEGFRITRGVTLDTSFRAEWGQGEPVIGFLGEYDALPGLSQRAGVAVQEPDPRGSTGHGCGHNLLGVGSMIGALGMKKFLEEEGLPGTVVYFGCPAEEGGGGKVFMAREGLFDGVDFALCWHPAPITMMFPGSVMANCVKRYSFYGKASHAAASPEKGRSALDALELMNIGIQFLREHVPTDTRIHYAITDTGGNAPNVVQAFAEGLYETRAPHSRDALAIMGRLDDIAQGAALMTGTEVRGQFVEGTCETITIPALDEVMDRNLREVPNTALEASDVDLAAELVKTQVAPDEVPAQPIDIEVRPYDEKLHLTLPGSSDTGDVSWVCPLSQCGVACWPAGTVFHTWQVVASGKSDFAHRGMLYLGQVLAATALDAYQNPEIIAEAKKQHSEGTAGMPYQCSIPADVTPEMLKGLLE